MEINYYEILGLEKTATKEEIKIAYRSLAKTYHPDVNSASNAAVFFRQVKEAFDVLYDDEQRRNYDMRGNQEQRREYYEEPPKPEPESSYEYYYPDKTASTYEPEQVMKKRPLIIRMVLGFFKLIIKGVLFIVLRIIILFCFLGEFIVPIAHFLGYGIAILSVVLIVFMLKIMGFESLKDWEAWVVLGALIVCGIIGLVFPPILEKLICTLEEWEDSLDYFIATW